MSPHSENPSALASLLVARRAYGGQSTVPMHSSQRTTVDDRTMVCRPLLPAWNLSVGRPVDLGRGSWVSQKGRPSSSCAPCTADDAIGRRASVGPLTGRVGGSMVLVVWGLRGSARAPFLLTERKRDRGGGTPCPGCFSSPSGSSLLSFSEAHSPSASEDRRGGVCPTARGAGASPGVSLSVRQSAGLGTPQPLRAGTAAGDVSPIVWDSSSRHSVAVSCVRLSGEVDDDPSRNSPAG